MTKSSVRTRALLQAQTSDALAAIRDSLRRAVEKHRVGDVFELPMPAVLATGVKL
jgi:hypothetical protein